MPLHYEQSEWNPVVTVIPDQPCLHRGLEIQRSIREYFSLCVIPSTIFLANPRWTLKWTTDLKKHQQCPYPRRIHVFEPIVMGNLEMWIPREETPVDGGVVVEVMLLTATDCPEFIAALTLKGTDLLAPRTWRKRNNDPIWFLCGVSCDSAVPGKSNCVSWC